MRREGGGEGGGGRVGEREERREGRVGEREERRQGGRERGKERERGEGGRGEEGRVRGCKLKHIVRNEYTCRRSHPPTLVKAGYNEVL